MRPTFEMFDRVVIIDEDLEDVWGTIIEIFLNGHAMIGNGTGVVYKILLDNKKFGIVHQDVLEVTNRPNKENLYWYKAHQNTHPRPQLTDMKIVSNHFGYIIEPPYEDIEKYDLRFVDRCTTDELFDKYF